MKAKQASKKEKDSKAAKKQRPWRKKGKKKEESKKKTKKKKGKELDKMDDEESYYNRGHTAIQDLDYIKDKMIWMAKTRKNLKEIGKQNKHEKNKQEN